MNEDDFQDFKVVTHHHKNLFRVWTRQPFAVIFLLLFGRVYGFNLVEKPCWRGKPKKNMERKQTIFNILIWRSTRIFMVFPQFDERIIIKTRKQNVDQKRLPKLRENRFCELCFMCFARIKPKSTCEVLINLRWLKCTTTLYIILLCRTWNVLPTSC